MKPVKKIYRIEIQSPAGGRFKFWIGANLELVHRRDQAVLVTEEEHISVMERIDCPAIAYSEPMTFAEGYCAAYPGSKK